MGTSPIDGQSAVQYRPGQDPEVRHLVRARVPGRHRDQRRARRSTSTPPTPAWQSSGADEVPALRTTRSRCCRTARCSPRGGQNGTDGVDQTTGILADRDLGSGRRTRGRRRRSSRRPRLYHSSALLLPDGRVLLAGGGAFGNAVNEKSGEIYSPPYLFKGPRPAVTGRTGPRQLRRSSFNVDTPDASRIQKVTWSAWARSRTTSTWTSARAAQLHRRAATACRITGPAERQRRASRLVHGVPGRQQRRAVQRPDRSASTPPATRRPRPPRRR